MLTCNIGGSLAVRHLGKKMVFDWATAKAGTKKESIGDSKEPSVQWAAFYSDCEHEVHGVKNGHRVTLTYNLYVCRGQGHLAGATPVLDPTQLPLYKGLKRAIASPQILKRGTYEPLEYQEGCCSDITCRSNPRHLAQPQLRTYKQTPQLLAVFPQRRRHEHLRGRKSSRP